MLHSQVVRIRRAPCRSQSVQFYRKIISIVHIYFMNSHDTIFILYDWAASDRSGFRVPTTTTVMSWHKMGTYMT
jgi:hypothetical protein